MSKERLLPSDVADWKARASAPRPGRVFLDIDPQVAFVKLCNEVEACWSERKLLEPIALAAAQLIVETDPRQIVPSMEKLRETVGDWQRSKREAQ